MTEPLAPRIDYTGEGLAEADLAATPFRQAQAWIEDAVRRQAASSDVPEPLALSLASVDAAGAADVRTVLLRFFSPEGLGFVTSLTSAKSRQIAAQPRVAAALTWPAIFRAIRVRGAARRIDDGQIAEYFGTRPWGSRISAWASEQSAPIAGRAGLEARYDEIAATYPDTGSPDDVPVPPSWGGWLIVPDEVEFWAGRRSRLHDRLVFTRVGPGTLDDPEAWEVSRRQP